MSYVVLARKLRPIRFDDLIGQETIARILKNAIRSQRVAHAFLFAGSRGVGKTSAARILTRAINCLNPQEADPCNACLNCLEILQNASPDVYEIDAASNRGIENIRELRDNINYAPAKCRYKVYIIDEVHMLTTESFNALLKTLEEPPAHVKFILATTDPHKIPATILSRCQRYDFLRIPMKAMADYLEQVATQEGIPISRKALEMVAQQAVGGMRDALTSIDQILSYTGTTPTDEQVASVLGMIDARSRFRLLTAVLQKETAQALEAFYAMQQHGHDFQDILADLLSTVKNLSLVQTFLRSKAGTLPPTLFQEISADEIERYRELHTLVSPSELQQIFHLLLELEEQMKRSSHAQVCFEMAIVQMSQVEALANIPELLRQVQAMRQGKPSGSVPPRAGVSPSLKASIPEVPRATISEPPKSQPAPASPRPASFEALRSSLTEAPKPTSAVQEIKPPPSAIEKPSEVPLSLPIQPKETSAPSIPEPPFTLKPLPSIEPAQPIQSVTFLEKTPPSIEPVAPPSPVIANPAPGEAKPLDLSGIELDEELESPSEELAAERLALNSRASRPMPTFGPVLEHEEEGTPEEDWTALAPSPGMADLLRKYQAVPAKSPEASGKVALVDDPVLAPPIEEVVEIPTFDLNSAPEALLQTWEKLVGYVQKHSPSLVSMLKNALPLRLDPEGLAITFKGAQFEAMLAPKLESFQQYTQTFFRAPLKVTVQKDSPLAAQALTIAEQYQKKLEAARQHLTETARQHPQVQNILHAFPKSRIIDIQIPEPKFSS